MSTIHWFLRPYPLEKNTKKKLLGAAGFGLFVFLFLWSFEPFGIGALKDKLLPIALGYGAVTFVVMVFLNVLLLNSLSKFANENSWTVYKEALWSLLNILTIGLGNLLYSNWISLSDFSWINLGYFAGYTAGIGIFPLLFVVYNKERQMRKHFESDSSKINDQRTMRTLTESATKEICIHSENQNEALSLSPDSLLFIQAAENYCDVFYLENQAVVKKTLRIGIGAAEKSLADQHPSLLRCHKSFLVNKDRVNNVSGNAQGYKLHFEKTAICVPVSRSLNKTLSKHLAI